MHTMGFQTMLESGDKDIRQPYVAHRGGTSELRWIAAIAEA